MTWREEWAADIAEATKQLPDSCPLDERIKMVDAVKDKSPGAYATSWGKKSWQAARRDYLMKFGYIPKTKKVQQAKAAGMPLFDQ